MRQRVCFKSSESDYPVAMLSFRIRTILQVQRCENFKTIGSSQGKRLLYVSQSLQIAENYKEEITRNFKDEILLFMTNNQK